MTHKLHVVFSQVLSPTGIPSTPAGQSTITKILTLTFVTIGAIAVLMFIIGGLRYIFARGNAEAVKTARNTMVYSAVGMVIAATAVTLVNFILVRLK